MEKRKVTFNDNIEIHFMYVWAYAYRKSRERYWEVIAADSARFKRRIKTIENILEPILVKKRERCTSLYNV